MARPHKTRMQRIDYLENLIARSGDLLGKLMPLLPPHAVLEFIPQATAIRKECKEVARIHRSRMRRLRAQAHLEMEEANRATCADAFARTQA